MNVIPSQQLLEQLRWRYATKAFDPVKKIPAEMWRTLEEALVLTPSSFGLQPWKFIVITDSALREKLKAASWNQAQVTEASHLVVFAVTTTLTEGEVDRYIRSIASTRNQPVDAPSLTGLKKMILGFVSQPGFSIQDWAAKQAYIALGNFMTAAALLGVDTCPMEGLDPKQYDAILGLPAQNLATVVACPAGYRSADDKYATLAKVRYSHQDLIWHR